jgi:parvulin-like peptidyl-prolyl isomerase
MTFRSRPVLDRRHRPRWQDELRTQQLTIIAFALAIALALGIFGAAAWSGYWDTHFRPVASVAGTTFDRGDLSEREAILRAELIAAATELQAQLGGPRDQFIQQQIDSISLQLSGLDTTAAQSLVDGAVLAARAGDYGVSVSDEAVEAEIAERTGLPERIRAQLILVAALPDDAEADDEPTEEQLAEARTAAQAARDRVQGGEDFAAVAGEVSDDFTASAGGVLGWFGADDFAYDEYFTALADAEPDDLVGPIETDDGFAVLRLVERREATSEGPLRDLLRGENVSDTSYREYLRGELLTDAFTEYFADEIVTSPAPQRRVAQILISADAQATVPQERARHVLVQPLPDATEQADATDEEWAAAEEVALEVRDLVLAEDADWFEIAEAYSHDPGSAVRGGDLGWYDPEASPFVTEFADALAELEVGEVSEPVRSQFGWHVIQKTGERESPQEQAEQLAAMLRDDPDAFAEMAERVSEDHATAREGGEVGWIARYERDRMFEDAVFGLDAVGEIGQVDAGTAGITIIQLLEVSDSREIEEIRLAAIHRTGATRWLDDEVRSTIETWVDPQYASASAA